MKVLAAVGLRQDQEARATFAAYGEVAELALAILLRSEAGKGLLLDLEAEGGRGARKGPPLLLALGTDLGLCGQLNERVARFAAERLPSLGTGLAPGPRVVAVGERLASRCEEFGLPLLAWLPAPSNPGGSLELCLRGLLELLGAEEGGLLPPSLLVIHPRRSPGQGEECICRRLLPLDLGLLRTFGGRAWEGPSLPIYRMEARAFLRASLGELLFRDLHAALVDALECENGARLEAMRGAERQLEDHLEGLRASYNGARQEAITAELLDIVAGLEAELSQVPARAAEKRRAPSGPVRWKKFS